MIKYLSFCLVLLAGIGALQAQSEITVQMDLPPEVVAGQEFQVSVEIDKGNLEEFSRFQQELPAGLTAIQENSGSADFTFENQRIRFIWLKLPVEKKINISYRVKVNERLKGALTLFGEFSYVENNERRSIIIDEQKMTILPSPDVPVDRQIEIAEFAAVMAKEKAAVSSGIEVNCIRQTPYVSRTGNDILVHLLVYKKNMNKFAKIEERIPEGFEARSMESRDGLFTFKDGIAKFVWMNLPEVPGFKISYRLLPTEGKSISDLSIDGTLSYIEEGRNVEVKIIQQDIDLQTVNDANMESVVAAVMGGEQVPAETRPREEVKPPPVREPEVEKPPVRTGTSAAASGIPKDQLLPVSDGVYFRVQLAATKHFRDVNQAFGKYRLSKPVFVEYTQEYYKYTAGSFSTYSQAREFKNFMTSSGIQGAFIVGYRNGRRIDIMDALQATGGK